MSDILPKCTLLDELDSRQNEVLEQLEVLNAQIESLLKNLLVRRAEPVQ